MQSSAEFRIAALRASLRFSAASLCARSMAMLAMAEQRVVMDAVARRTDLVADDPAPERAVHRNVTMIPSRGARVVVRERRPATAS
jgi:hypothetical protein